MHAWIAMAFGDENSPYADEPSVAYAYDDRVQNHKQVQVGDLLFLRNRVHLEGVGRIGRIHEGTGEKIFHRCPEFGTGRIHQRKGLSPPYKCHSGHKFAYPKEISLQVCTFKASFARSWLSTGASISVAELRPFELRDSKQLAIMPAEADGLCRYVARRCSNIGPQLMTWIGARANTIDDIDADDDPEYTALGPDERERITRGIRLRRGQAAFRNCLIDRHESQCLISGCRVLGVLEAAHIRPYRRPRDNHPGNGLLLRSDLHTLFDLNHIAIDPQHLTIVLHPSLLDSEYRDVHGKSLLVTKESAPDKRALALRWKEFTAAGGLGNGSIKETASHR
jgi:putative restriction endonuclease